jgi:hypothetical protein
VVSGLLLIGILLTGIAMSRSSGQVLWLSAAWLVALLVGSAFALTRQANSVPANQPRRVARRTSRAAPGLAVLAIGALAVAPQRAILIVALGLVVSSGMAFYAVRSLRVLQSNDANAS